MVTTRKFREVDVTTGLGTYTSSSGTVTNYPVRVAGRQETTSEGHRVSLLKKKTGKDIGGEFFTRRAYEKHSDFPPPLSYDNGGTIQRAYQGPRFAYSQVVDYKSNQPQLWPAWFPDTPVLTLDRLGATAIARTIPTNPISGAATAIGELREGLPSLVGHKLFKERSRQAAGGEYLNYQFGIMPMVSDFKKFVEASKKSDKVLAQLARDSGKNVRRRYAFPEERVTVVDAPLSPRYSQPAVDATLYGSPGTLHRKEVTTTKYWFSGAYTYYLPPKGSWQRREAELNKLYGTRITAEVLWNLAPWSWAIDWFTNAGDVIANISAFANDGLVLRYGYLMEHKVREVEYVWTGTHRYGNVPTPCTLTQTFGYETKRRVRATPYGFGLSFDGFSTRQLAIIAALGISRS